MGVPLGGALTLPLTLWLEASGLTSEKVLQLATCLTCLMFLYDDLVIKNCHIWEEGNKGALFTTNYPLPSLAIHEVVRRRQLLIKIVV